MAKQPKLGDPFWCNGFPYVLTGSEVRYATGRKQEPVRHTIRHFQRPLASSEEEGRAHKHNFSYRRGGSFNEAELHWLTYEQLLDRIEQVGRVLELTATEPAVRVWAPGAVEALKRWFRADESRQRGAWVLANHVLLELPVVQREGKWVTVVPRTPQEARAVAELVLEHQLPAGREG